MKRFYRCALPVVAIFFSVSVFAAIDAPHNDSNNISCGSCHDSSVPNSPLWVASADINAFCMANCHGEVAPPYTGTAAPLAIAHSSANTSTRHGVWQTQCTDCHDPHNQRQKLWKGSHAADLYLARGTVTGYFCYDDLNADLVQDGGEEECQAKLGAGGSLLRPVSVLAVSGVSFKSGWDASGIVEKTSPERRSVILPSTGRTAYNYPVVAMDGATVTVEGNVGPLYKYVAPPTSFGILYGQFIKQVIGFSGSDKYAKFFDNSGAYGFAYDESGTQLDPTPTGICQVCHTQANHWRNDGTRANHYSGQNCTANCHLHDNGFAHGSGAGGSGCDSCHGHDAGYEYEPGLFSEGRGSVQSHSTHTENDADDLKGPNIGCNGCHDTNNFPAFKSGTDSNGDGVFTLDETDVCNPCHSPGGTYDGVNDPVLGAKNIWSTGAYLATNDSTLASGKQKWCATCHDEAPSVVQAVSAPNVVGDEDGAFPYGVGWGFYKTGHGVGSGSTYPSSGGLVYGAGTGCEDCHDLTTAHVDGDARTYSSGSDNYAAGFRLKTVSGWAPLNIPREDQLPLDSDDFQLCFACHDPNMYLVDNTGSDLVTTRFRDDTNIGSGWNSGKPLPVNLHEYHLDFVNLSYDSDWTGGFDSRITCVTCHNVHGSTQHSMVRDGKLVGREPGLVMWYGNATTVYNPPWPIDPPTNYVLLSASNRTVWYGASAGNVCGNCHGGNYVKYDRSPPGAQVAPVLSWTGEAGFVADGVEPDSGQGGDYFTFRVTYTDANYQMPRAIQVWVDQDDSGTFDAGEKYDMYGVDSGDMDVSDGKLYRRILSLNRAGDGTLAYRFYATDGPDEATGAPTHPSANTLTVTNNAPTLGWTDEAGYQADGVNPNSGGSGASFSFRVNYTDADNQAPTTVQVWIDRNDDGDYLDAGEKIDLAATDGGDTYYADGKLYATTVTLAAAGDNSLAYRFYARDGSADATGVATANLAVAVNPANSAPTLVWTSETNFVGDGVHPDADVGGATFSFRVLYADSDNHAPSSIQLWVDANDDDDFDDPGEKLDLTAVDGGDTDYSDGKLYAASLVLDEAGDGILAYRFFASDGSLDASGEPVAGGSVTILMGAFKVSCDGTGDYDYLTIQEAIDNAADGDTILVADGTCTGAITVDNKDLTIKSVNGAGATTINGNGAATAVSLLNGADTTLQGFTITGGAGGTYGGGVKVSASSPTVRDCTVSGNSSQRAAGLYVTGSGSLLTLSDSTVSGNTSSLDGPGLYLESGTSATVSGAAFTGNSTTNGRGGGIYMTSSAVSTLSVSGSGFSGNATTNSGGAIFVNVSAGGTVNVTVGDSDFAADNTGSTRGGALYMIDGGGVSALSITNSTLRGVASIEGGALYLSNVDSTTISNTTFENSSAQSGGAVWGAIGSGSLAVSDSIFRNNVATSTYGGGLNLSGGTLSFERCLITGNSCGNRGGGVYISASTGAPALTTFANSIISGNKTTGFEGGGLYLTDDGLNSHAATIVNTTLSGNFAQNLGGAVAVAGTAAVTVKNSILYRNGGKAGAINSEVYGTIAASYSDIRQSGYTGGNNINADPQFIDPVSWNAAPTSSGNYHLLLSSPTVDMGTAAGAPTDDIDGNLRPIGTGIDMGADEVVTVANTAPTVTWTGESGYSGDGANPDRGSGGSSFEFRVRYADADNHPPGAVQVWIDEDDNGSYEADEKYAMVPVDGGDLDYTDGKLYTVTLVLASAGDGAISYRFFANDSIEAATGVATAGATVVVNDAPSLAWEGSANYVADGVHPDSAAAGSTFEFRVSYTDTNGNPPTAIQLWIDANDDGDYLDAGEKLGMAPFLPADTDVTDGKVYFRQVVLSGAGDNAFTYRFYASDGDQASGPPTSDATVTLVNTAPTLAWVGSGNFTADGVHPNNAVGGASYQFRVNYTDADNQAPASIQVWIDRNDDGDYLDAGEKLDMTEEDGGDTDYTDGKLYSHTLAIAYAGSGDGYQSYRFSAGDGTDAATGSPTSDSLVGVFAANNPPDLDWTGEANYAADGANPDAGAVGDTFTFRVKYTDIENIAPTSIQVWVDLDDDGTSAGDEGSELFAMTGTDAGDTTYDDGKLYSKDVVVSAGGDGTILYNFRASDGTDIATGNATANMTIAVNTPITVCASGCDFVKIQWAIDDAGTNPGDFILVKDGSYAENINYNGKNITIYSQNGAGSTFITGAVANNAAVVTFSPSDPLTGAVLDGFTIDNSVDNSATRGIYISGSSPTIRNSTIQDNNAPNATNGGGGVYVVNGSPTFDTCVIRDNTTLNRTGGGMYITGLNSGATIVNSTIGGDNPADQNFSNNGKAGAIYFENSTGGALTITNSTIKNNVAQTFGAGLYLINITNPTVITGSTLNSNTANGEHGGAIYASNAPVRLNNSHVDNNKVPSTKGGAGIYMVGATSSLVVENNSTISNNNTSAARAAYGAAIYITGSTAATPLSLSDTVIDNNHSSNNGGAVSMSTLTNTSYFSNVTVSNNSNDNGNGGGIFASAAPLEITGGAFTGNSSPATRSGGGLYVESTSASIASTAFTGNSAGTGGGFGSGGTAPVLTVDKVRVQGNSAPNGGGGIQIGAGNATITNTLVTGNTVDNDYKYGGGIQNVGTLNLLNSTISGNYAYRDGGGLEAAGTETIRNCIIYGNSITFGNPAIRGSADLVEYSDVKGGHAGTGNIDTDPLFVTLQQAGLGAPTTAGDFRLSAASACIDTAGATSAPADDILGVARPVDITGKGDGVDDYDMGAYEYQP